MNGELVTCSKIFLHKYCKYTLDVFADSYMYSPSVVQRLFHSDWFRGNRHQLFSHANYTLFLQSILQLHVHVLFRNYKMDENYRPRKQARLDTFLIPRRDEKSQR